MVEHIPDIAPPPKSWKLTRVKRLMVKKKLGSAFVPYRLVEDAWNVTGIDDA